jgi:RNA polymerase sigma-70 factor (ECF subfamily)
MPVRNLFPTTPGPDAVVDALLLAVGRGDRTALGAFYDRTAPSVFGLLSTALGGSGRAERVTEEIYLRLWRMAPVFDPGERSAHATLSMLARRALFEHVLGTRGLSTNAESGS